MKITKVTPLIMGTAWRNLTFVKVETDEGLTGVGVISAVVRLIPACQCSDYSATTDTKNGLNARYSV